MDFMVFDERILTVLREPPIGLCLAQTSDILTSWSRGFLKFGLCFYLVLHNARLVVPPAPLSCLLTDAHFGDGVSAGCLSG